MEDLSGIGKSMDIKSVNAPVGCMGVANHAKEAGWMCNNTNCPFYNSWKCIWGL